MAIPKPNITRITIPTNHYANGRAAAISQISEHHVVGDAIHVINKAKSEVVFSTTFTIGTDGTIYQLVDIDDTPFCDNNYYSNARSITIEHAGGGNFPYTEAMYQSSIALHAWLFSVYGMLNCIRHRDIPEIKADPSKATACPGQLDVERIVREAQNLIGGKGGSMSRDAISTEEDIELHEAYLMGRPGVGYNYANVGKPLPEVINFYKTSPYRQAVVDRYNAFDSITRQLSELRAKMDGQADYEEIKSGLVACEIEAKQANEKVAQYETERAEDTQTGNAFIRWIGRLFKGG